MKALLPLLLILIIGSVSACTTASDIQRDIERVDHSVNRKFELLTTSVKDELRDIKSIQLAQDKRQDDLTKSIDALKAAVFSNVESMRRTYDNLDRSTRQLAESLRTDVELQQHLLKDHQSFEGSVGALQTTVEGMSPLAMSLEQQVQRLTDILRESYKTELLGLRERLKTLEALSNPPTQLRSEHAGSAPSVDKKGQTKRD